MKFSFDVVVVVQCENGMKDEPVCPCENTIIKLAFFVLGLVRCIVWREMD